MGAAPVIPMLANSARPNSEFSDESVTTQKFND